jgi:FixJ family two-component response regulator
MPRGYRVHVVDDEPLIRDAASSLIAVLGHDPVLWESGESFLAHARPLADECILLDVRLGGIDGLEVLGKLRDSGVTTPVVVMTGQSERWMEPAFLDHGATWLLDKPFSLGDLDHALTIAEAAGARRAAERCAES